MKFLLKKIIILAIIISIVSLIFNNLSNNKVQKHYSKSYEITSEYTNKNPIVLLHGFLGYDRDFKNGDYYWGRTEYGDIQEIFNKSGYKIMTASVSPYASNWHRACELYAYIKGGTVDYGEYTSKKYGHKRYGRTYEGIYKEWGNKNPIHIVAHSQGGQTARVLAHLLSNGHNEEINSTDSTKLSNLFKNDKTMNKSIISITTIATPHDGTSFVEFINKKLGKNAYRLLPFSTLIKKPLLDYKLDYWELNRFNNENTFAYLNRIRKNKAFKQQKAFAFWDLSMEGAKELNEWVKDSKDVYYISYALKATDIQLKDNKYQINYLNGIDDSSKRMAKFVLNGMNFVNFKDNKEIKNKYLDNDGVVNTYSAIGPKINSSSIINSFKDNEANFNKGEWTSMPILNISHSQVVGSDVSDSNFNLTLFYNELFSNIGLLELKDNNLYKNIKYKSSNYFK